MTAPFFVAMLEKTWGPYPSREMRFLVHETVREVDPGVLDNLYQILGAKYEGWHGNPPPNQAVVTFLEEAKARARTSKQAHLANGELWNTRLIDFKAAKPEDEAAEVDALIGRFKAKFGIQGSA